MEVENMIDSLSIKPDPVDWISIAIILFIMLAGGLAGIGLIVKWLVNRVFIWRDDEG